ncbi:MAG TPA: hypothetical protein VHS80_11720, partial [Chthoniobacterales bacterium]|nr:hypothetical protein [Chthoniobacterales bacterium]
MYSKAAVLILKKEGFSLSLRSGSLRLFHDLNCHPKHACCLFQVAPYEGDFAASIGTIIKPIALFYSKVIPPETAIASQRWNAQTKSLLISSHFSS